MVLSRLFLKRKHFKRNIVEIEDVEFADLVKEFENKDRKTIFGRFIIQRTEKGHIILSLDFSESD